MFNTISKFYLSILSISLLISSCNSLSTSNHFEDVLIPAKETKNGDYGFVNLNGELIIDFDLDLDALPSLMCEGRSSFTDFDRDNKLSFISFDDGEVNIEKTKYTTVSYFSEGLALAVEETGSLVYIDTELNEQIVLDKSFL